MERRAFSDETDLMLASGPSSRACSPIHFSFSLSLSSLLLSHYTMLSAQAVGLFVQAGKTASSFSVCGNGPWRRIVAREMVTLTPRGTSSPSSSMGAP